MTKHLLYLSLFVLVLSALLMQDNPAAANEGQSEDNMAVDYQTITSAGPFTELFIGADLSSQVAHAQDTVYQVYPPNTKPGDYGTFLVVDDTLYGPDFRNHDGSATWNLGSYTVFTEVSQSTVTGSGTSSDPFQVVTVVDAGSTGLRITQTDSYIVGQELYRTDIEVANSGDISQDIILYRALDCYLGNSDYGYGVVNSTMGGIACAKTANNTPSARIQQIYPLTGGSQYYQAGYSEVWNWISTKQPFPNTCRCEEYIDNGAGISWSMSIPAGEMTFSHIGIFSPEGRQPLTTGKTADEAMSAVGETNGYTITISNPNPVDVGLNSIIDDLPTGFTVVPGSTTGATTDDPTVANQRLTWSGPFTVTANSNLSLSFDVTVSDTPGMYFNNATAEAENDSVIPTGDSAPITVGPEIDVQGNSTSIADGDNSPDSSDHTDFGNVALNSNYTNTFTISNTGAGMLNLSLPITLSPTGYFTVTSQPSAAIAAGQVSSFSVTFRPTARQLYTATVSIVNDDSDENPYDFVIAGSVPPPSSNQGPQLDRPLPDITVVEGAADQTWNLRQYFSNSNNRMYFRILNNSNRVVAPYPLVGAEFENEMLIRFGEPGQTVITVAAVDWATEETYQGSFTITVTEAPEPTLSISQTVSDNEVSAGQQITYTITVANSGPGTATNAQISDSLPAGLTFVANSIRATGLSTGTLGTQPPTLASGVTLAANETLEISFAATVNNDVEANHMMTNTVELTANDINSTMQASSMIMVIAPDSPADQDVDGVNDDIEAGVPNFGGDGTGDGNGDNIPDYEQQNVASLPNSTNGDYVTLALDPGLELVDVKAIENPAASLPDGVDFPQGFFEFNIAGVEPGESVEMSVIWHSEDDNNWPNSYWKYGPTPDNPTDHWYNFDFDDTTGAEMDENFMILVFVDGERGDADLTANGQIHDPGGLAIYTTPTALSLSHMQSQAPIERYAGALLALLLVAGLLLARRRKEK